MDSDAPADPGAVRTYEDCLLTLWAGFDDPAPFDSYLDAAHGGGLAAVSDDRAYRELVATQVADGYLWPELERAREAVREVFPDPETVAAFDESDRDRIRERGTPVSDDRTVERAVDAAEGVLSVREVFGSFVGHLRELDEYEAATAAVATVDGVDETTAHRFLVSLGYRPAVARDEGVTRLFDRIGFDPSPAAREAAVEAMVAGTPDGPAAVARVLRTHAGSDENFSGPTPPGRDPVFPGVCTPEPACARCRVENCASRREPFGGDE
ncbi:MAG: DNA-3-methyladenine glycosylase I [Haloarculaceae archaeon]